MPCGHFYKHWARDETRYNKAYRANGWYSEWFQIRPTYFQHHLRQHLFYSLPFVENTWSDQNILKKENLKRKKERYFSRAIISSNIKNKALEFNLQPFPHLLPIPFFVAKFSDIELPQKRKIKKIYKIMLFEIKVYLYSLLMGLVCFSFG
jgi:hypothetical protein